MTMNSFTIYTTKIKRLGNAFKIRSNPNCKQQCELVSKTSKKKVASINNLPDEVIILILSELTSDLDTIQNVMTISKRMADLSLHVLANCMLPIYSIEVIIDQEGINRTFTQFKFGGVDTETHSVCFVARLPSIKRYTTNKEAPTIRQAMLEYHSSALPLNGDHKKNVTGEQGEALSDKMNEKESTQLDRIKNFHPAMCTTVSKVLLETRNQKIHKVKQEGIYSLQSSRLFSSPLYNKNYTNTQNRSMWKLGYQIDHKTKKEYDLTPLYLNIHASYFIELIQCKKNKKSLT
ncbi:unnamed protein product [Rhizopus stolonifer]